MKEFKLNLRTFLAKTYRLYAIAKKIRSQPTKLAGRERNAPKGVALLVKGDRLWVLPRGWLKENKILTYM